MDSNLRNAATDHDEAAKSRTFYEIMVKRVESQLNSAAIIDQKISYCTQSFPLIITVLLAILVALKDRSSSLTVSIAGVGLFLFFVAMSLLIHAQNPLAFSQGSNWQELAIDVKNTDLSEGDFHYRYAYYLGKQAFEENNKLIDSKTEWFKRAIYPFAAAVILLVIAIFICLIRAR